MKKPKSPAFSFYTADWNGSVRVRMMTLEERGAYITLLTAAWDEVGLPDDLPYIARLLDLKAGSVRFKRIWDRLRAAFFLEGTRWYNRRQEIERARQAEFSAKQADRINKRWGKGKDTAEVPRNNRGRNPVLPPDPDPIPTPPKPPAQNAAQGLGNDPTPIAEITPKAVPPEASEAWRAVLRGEKPAPRREDVS